MKKKAQAAMEFLMTYGWAILVVLIAIGVLAYFGVLSPEKLLPRTCTLMPGLACGDFQVTATGVTLIITNDMGQDVTFSSLAVTPLDGTACTGAASGDLADGTTDTFSITGCSNGAVGDIFKGSIDITYTIDTLTHTQTGNLVAPVEA